MHPTTTAIAKTWVAPPFQRNPNELLATLARTRLEQAEWRVVRTGLALMAWSLTAVLICVASAFLTGWFDGKFRFPYVRLFFVFLVAVLPLAGAAYLGGVLLSLIAPRRARLSGWIATYVIGLIVGIVLLGAALVWRGMAWRFAAVSWSAAPRILALSGVAALLVALLGYCLYLAGIARRFGAGRLALCFVAFYLTLPVQSALIALAEASSVFWHQPWLPGGMANWKEELYYCAGGMLIGMGLVWPVLLWRLRRLLPREEGGYEPDED